MTTPADGPITLVPVRSSTVAEMGYNADDAVLAVRFHSSPDPYFYRGVPHGLWLWLETAPSIGKFLHAYVKPQFACTRTYPVLRCAVHDAILVTDGAQT